MKKLSKLKLNDFDGKSLHEFEQVKILGGYDDYGGYGDDEWDYYDEVVGITINIGCGKKKRWADCKVVCG